MEALRLSGGDRLGRRRRCRQGGTSTVCDMDGDVVGKICDGNVVVGQADVVVVNADADVCVVCAAGAIPS